MKNKEKKHLPIFGIGPFLCFPMAIISAIGIVLSIQGIIPGSVENTIIKWIMFFFGVVLIALGIALFFGADLKGKLIDSIKANQLKTNGSYRFVRNPCYCVFLLGSTGALLINHNVILLVLPFLFWLEMTVVLINTEEKWLTKLYGQEYKDYCKRVNRCIPWFPRKK